MQSKILLVGQAPARESDGKPLEGRIGERIASLAGITVEQYLYRTDRMNVLNQYPGRSKGKGDAFPMKEAKLAVSKKAHVFSGRLVVFLGKSTAWVFGASASQYLTWRYSSALCCWFAVLPHPSGIVRWWNSKDNKRQPADFLHSLLGGVSP